MTEKRILHEGEISLGDNIIPCYVLEDGTRILSTLAMQRALGVTGNEPEQRSSKRLDEILSSAAVRRFTSDSSLSSKLSPIVCKKGEQRINGYDALVLPEICEIMLKVRDYSKENNLQLGVRQRVVITQADILMRALARVGIIALIDEATGYQYEREQFALNAILKALVSDEILEYQQQFQLSFYREIFRLWGIPFTEYYIRHKPSFIGHLTNRYIYSNLPAGTFVLGELKKRTPKTERGNYKYKLHQSLTEDNGREALKKVLYSVEALASVSKDKAEFDRLVNERYGQKELPFPEFDSYSKENKILKENVSSNFNKSLAKTLKKPSE